MTTSIREQVLADIRTRLTSAGVVDGVLLEPPPGEEFIRGWRKAVPWAWVTETEAGHTPELFGAGRRLRQTMIVSIRVLYHSTEQTGLHDGRVMLAKIQQAMMKDLPAGQVGNVLIRELGNEILPTASAAKGVLGGLISQWRVRYERSRTNPYATE